ncbi:PTS system, beta-glucoside-specific IIABC component [Spiroplasma corruscae]|uniref:PTS system, beta-glucoside-specific IIABC component n=1 Tax=Spiroplasma corruscae TaxID=216934 RepID=A0A222EQE7_9MOLU|nr:PTS glucose transporter subunit IIA [Spiroplasma corruscae]ASP28463.1 PTS system, beta-glucoside-specific IIABC component [Spiroplasma corruscae]
MKIKIFAPCDGSATSLQDLKDGVFSEKLLGDGIVFYPKSSDFFSVMQEGTLLQIFETKHAYFFKDKEFENSILMHIGLDTVKLKGKPFSIVAKEKEEINKNSLIVKVDIDYIKNENISIATPITVSGDYEYSIENITIGDVKKGECLFEINYEIKDIVKDKESNIAEFKSKYLLAAEQFIKDIGGQGNYKDAYNCMTRLRLSIIDKELVNIKSIEKNKLVKGVVWNGFELQIIIGGECYKVKDEILNLRAKQSGTPEINSEKLRPSLSKIFLGIITGIMAPNVPIILASGILSAVYALFASLGLVEDSANMNMLSAIMKIMSKTGILLVGIFFCMNTVKYFGGNILLGALLGLLLVSRFYYQTGVSDPELYKFGTYIQDSTYKVSGWYMFNIGDYPIIIRSYEGSILPFIFVGFISVYIDKWIKTWMPSTVDVVFRYPLVIILTITPTLFLLGPMLSLVEIGMAKLIGFIENWPLGIGVGIFAFIIQPLVFCGIHVAVYVTLQAPLIAQTGSSLILPGGQAAVWGQIGAAIGVLIMTKNKNLKTIIIGTLPSAAFGITETILYGVNIPKGRPFIIGCAAGAVGGVVMGTLGVRLQRLVGDGILYPMGLNGIDQLWFLIGSLVSLIAGILLTIFLYKERLNEYKYSKKISSKLRSFLIKYFPQVKVDNKEKLETLNKEFLNSKKEFLDYEKYLQKLTNIESKILKVEQKEENAKKKLYKKIKQLENKTNEFAKTKKDQYVNIYNNYSLDSEKLKLSLLKTDLVNENSYVINSYNTKTKSLEKSVDNFLTNLEKDYRTKYINNFKGGYWNAIHTVDISYGYEDIKVFGLNKKEKKDLTSLMIKGDK